MKAQENMEIRDMEPAELDKVAGGPTAVEFRLSLIDPTRPTVPTGPSQVSVGPAAST